MIHLRMKTKKRFWLNEDMREDWRYNQVARTETKFISQTQETLSNAERSFTSKVAATVNALRSTTLYKSEKMEMAVDCAEEVMQDPLVLGKLSQVIEKRLQQKEDVAFEDVPLSSSAEEDEFGELGESEAPNEGIFSKAMAWVRTKIWGTKGESEDKQYSVIETKEMDDTPSTGWLHWFSPMPLNEQVQVLCFVLLVVALVWTGKRS
eukprot:TRINITY_DN4010_c0_g1_i2.p1 TRINITY_DN4010_c0_g1~~TRINITY_DN4010_c0_g1_i2.p1  ORF type:complete len:207 (-),score=36.77 TRINITY_DN4010_c0_g1_i2:101-721(-)